MQNRNPNRQSNWGSYLLNHFFSRGTNPSSSAAAAAIATASTSSSSTASTAAATAAIPVSIVVSPSVARQPHGDFTITPPDVIRHVLAPMLDVRSLGRLDRTCRSIHATLSTFAGPLLLQKLAHYLVVEPNPAKVIAIIRANPKLLYSKIKEVSVNGISIRDYTPFQLAYGAGDVDAKENEGGMCEVLHEELARHLGNKEAAIAEIQRQVTEKKLNVIDQEKDNEIKDKLAMALRDVIQAIDNEQFNLGRDANRKLILRPATLTAINTFRAALDELQPKIVKEGMHFRSNTIQETWDAYIQAADTASWRYAYHKCALFADGALSYVLLSCFPVNDKQRLFGQGYCYLYMQERKEPFLRRMIIRDTNIKFDDYLRSPSVDFASLSGSYIDIINGKTADFLSFLHRDRKLGLTADAQLQHLCQTKTSNLQRLCSPVSPANHCSVSSETLSLRTGV